MRLQTEENDEVVGLLPSLVVEGSEEEEDAGCWVDRRWRREELGEGDVGDSTSTAIFVRHICIQIMTHPYLYFFRVWAVDLYEFSKNLGLGKHKTS